MDGVRLILAVHNHQPVGNFDDVFEAAYNDSYRPFLDVLEPYPEIPFALHLSGPLLEWLVERRPEYVERVRAMVGQGRVELLGGPIYEPILAMIPHRDRVGQIRACSELISEVFGVTPRGMWVPERVWEQQLVSSLAEAGMQYTLLDDLHFQRTGLGPDDLFGYYLTEEDGHLLKVFPNSERLRYLIPFREPHECYLYLRDLAQRQPGCTVVFGDDGEKFGSWPDTQKHVYQDGWLRHFCDMIMGNRSWLKATLFERVVDETLPRGKVYIPDGSYREMTEWVLPPRRFQDYIRVSKSVRSDPAFVESRDFFSAGGYWRNFKVKYDETDEMYARMLGLSRRLAAVGPDADPDLLEMARLALYRGQCNCPYWHGAFGGLYLPHLRNAIYHNLIEAHNLLDEAEGLPERRVGLAVGDFILDARREARIENDRLIAFVRPAQGGHVYELDVRHALCNVLATLQRRHEPYHDTIRSVLAGVAVDDGRAAISESILFKSEGLDRLLVYDDHPRKALVDHFYPRETTLEQLVAGRRDLERGDFVTGAYLASVQTSDHAARLIMERPGRADGHLVKIRKTIELRAGSPALDVRYELEDVPADHALRFAVEINLAAMAGHAVNRFIADLDGQRLGMLDEELDLPPRSGIRVTDEWLDVGVCLQWSHPAGVWCFPIRTVSQSEGGFESVFQSVAVMPYWDIVADGSGRWELDLSWVLDRAATEASRPGFRGQNQAMPVRAARV